MDIKTRSILFAQILDANSGYFPIADIEKRGIDRIYAYDWLAEQTGIQKLTKGLYARKDIELDPFYVLAYGHKNIVFSHTSALCLNGLISDIPLQQCVTVITGYNVKEINHKCRVFQTKPELHQMGTEEIWTKWNHKVHVYNKEKTICDMIRREKYFGDDLLRDALKNFFSDPKRDIERLIFYGEKLKIKQKLYPYIKMMN